MKYYFIALLLVLVSSVSSAATVPYTFGGLNVTREAGVTYLRGTSPSEMAAAAASVAGAVFSGTGTATVAGASTTFASKATLGSAASNALKVAVRATPGLAGAAMITWLASAGFEYLNGQWTKRETLESLPDDPPNTKYRVTSLQSWYPSPSTACDDAASNFTAYFGGWSGYSKTGEIYQNQCRIRILRPGTSDYVIDNSFQRLLNQTPSANPATDADWSALPAPTDAAYKEALEKGVKLPADKIEHTPPYKDVALGDPVVDPKTGKRMQDMARVTPSTSGGSADVQVVKVEVDTNGQPVINNTTNLPETQDQPDLCKLNPDASGCKPLDETEAPDLEKKENPFSLNPVSGFGADNAACPAPQTLFIKGGQTITWDWGKFCGFAQGIRPLIIGFAWLSALMIVVSVGRRNG